MPGSGHDQLIANGAVDLNGILDLAYLPGFVAEPGDSFVILEASQITNSFQSVIYPDLRPDWRIDYDRTNGTVTVILEHPADTTPPSVVSITPDATGPIMPGNGQHFTVVFSEPVTNFNDAWDLVFSTTNGVTTDSRIVTAIDDVTYSVAISGFGLGNSNINGSITLAVSTTADVTDLAGDALSTSVVSEPLEVYSEYGEWTLDKGFVPGTDDGFFQDANNDGYPNGISFAVDDDPLSSGGVMWKQRGAVIDVNGDEIYSLTFPVRTGFLFKGAGPASGGVDAVSYRVFGNVDLGGIPDLSITEMFPARDEGMAVLSNGYEYRTFRFNEALPNRPVGFMWLWIKVGNQPD